MVRAHPLSRHRKSFFYPSPPITLSTLGAFFRPRPNLLREGGFGNSDCLFFFYFAHPVRPDTYPAMNLENPPVPGETPVHPRPEGKVITMATIAKAAGSLKGPSRRCSTTGTTASASAQDARTGLPRLPGDGLHANDLRAVVRMYPETGDFALLISKETGAQRSFANALSEALLARIHENHLSLATYDRRSTTPPIRRAAASAGQRRRLEIQSC